MGIRFGLPPFSDTTNLQVQAIDEAMCEMVPSFLKLLQSPLTVLSLGQQFNWITPWLLLRI